MSEAPLSSERSDESMHPDNIAHTLTVSENSPVRVHLADTELTVPVTPVKERRSPDTATIECEYFDAVVDMITVADGGQTVHGRFHLPASEWQRLGLHTHWETNAAEDWRCERFIEIWLTRFQNTATSEYNADTYTTPAPRDSPTVTVYEEYDTRGDSPPAPFDRPELEFRAAVADTVTDYGEPHQRRTLCEVAAVEQRDEITDWPEKRDKSRPGGPVELPSRHPQIQFDEIDPLPITDDVITAVYVINRYAKQLSDEADAAYQSGMGAEAKVKSTRKKALYDVKTVAIHRLIKSNPAVVDVSVHDLNGDVEMYCFEFPNGGSFHQPKSAVSDGVLDVIDLDVSDADVERIEFTASTDVSGLETSLAEALGVLHHHGINVNTHLDTGIVEDYTWGRQLSTTFTIDGVES